MQERKRLSCHVNPVALSVPGSHDVCYLILCVFIFPAIFPTLDIRSRSRILSNSRFGARLMYWLISTGQNIPLYTVKI